MRNPVKELHILEQDKTIFDSEMEYIIPLYQRAYAWEDKQLIQLIEDIQDIPDNDNYYIGSLIVSVQGNKYEVVDGQQRLTSLYLLLNCLGIEVKASLVFACREKSNYTLRNIKELLAGDRSKIDMDRIEPGIERGIKILTQELSSHGFNKEEFIGKLSRVIVYRIEVPNHTDLNRYFEIMNTRGEQLEQHDILKASLMDPLPPDDAAVFAKIWDACSDMTGYVQMHFISKNNIVRDTLFGSSWECLPPKEWKTYKTCIKGDHAYGVGHRIENLIEPSFRVEENDGFLEDEERVRFEGIIEFPFFLLHTLKVLIRALNIQHYDGESTIIAELLDDKKLFESFTGVIANGCIDGKRISEDNERKAEFSRVFIISLLRIRYLFDKYIIKREYTNENSDGEWSLKSLKSSGQRSKKKPYYRNSRFAVSGEWGITNDYRVKSNIMIQSALRVSYTSPKVMHWITNLLFWLFESDCQHTCDNDIILYSGIAEEIAQSAVKKDFFDKCQNGKYDLGVNTPHVVFNYLDYLIWSANRKKYSSFVFEFRNSVEHWYPQNPSEGTFEQWRDGVDTFGNLCIIQRSVNSKFSNMAPEAKKSTFRDMIAKGSLKLRIMSANTEKRDDRAASIYWKEVACNEHEEKMIIMLKRACGLIGEEIG